MSGDRALQLAAPAKLNLWLRVLGRRADGYHEIETVMHAIALHDRIVAAPAPQGIALRVVEAAGGGMAVPADASNLAWRAAELFLARTGRGRGLRLHVTKRIPAGGGLGGGSSDAAATLRLANALSGSPLAPAELHELAVQLGADVAFFLRGGTQLARGIGERLQACPQPAAAHFVLVLPPFGTSTAAVYKTLAARLTGAMRAPSMHGHEVAALEGREACAGSGNDLAAAAYELHPELARLHSQLTACGRGELRLSGSGATLFAMFATARQADEAAAALQPVAAARGARLLRTQSAGAGLAEPAPGEWPEG
jgi:4-diphosphocytidyl-2-C-methyl-D-erythritol kinase